MQDEREIREAREEAARQAAVGASGEVNDKGVDREPHRDVPKASLGEEPRQEVEAEGEDKPHSPGGNPVQQGGREQGARVAERAPQRKAS